MAQVFIEKYIVLINNFLDEYDALQYTSYYNIEKSTTDLHQRDNFTEAITDLESKNM